MLLRVAHLQGGPCRSEVHGWTVPGTIEFVEADWARPRSLAACLSKVRRMLMPEESRSQSELVAIKA